MVKRIALFVSVLLGIVGLAVPGKLFAQDRLETAVVKFYVTGRVDGVPRAECTANGGDTVVTCGGRDAEGVYARLSGVAGATVVLPGGAKDMAYYLERLAVRVVRRERVGDYTIYYGYSPYVKAPPLNLSGGEANVQLALSNGKLSLGFPMLLTDF